MSHTMKCWMGLLVAFSWLVFSSTACLADASLFTYDGHTYEIVKTARTWAAAANDATTRQMYGVSGALVRIDNAGENAAIFNQLLAAIPSSEFTATDAPDGGGGAYAWIGATDRNAEGEWIWDGDGDNSGDQFWSGGKTGSPVGGLWSNWGTVGGTQNEPDNYNDQDAAGISLNGWPKSDQHLGSASQWNDVDVNNTLFYVVEFAAVPEPATSLLVLTGLVTMILWRARRRREL
ncbi:MAG: PEP-CTERM sorting domain-containing protein [Pirellulales bacterium]|nr:PEP-CTERM sorting domain-containing protein [Pirellulales bacterium]